MNVSPAYILMFHGLEAEAEQTAASMLYQRAGKWSSFTPKKLEYPNIPIYAIIGRRKDARASAVWVFEERQASVNI